MADNSAEIDRLSFEDALAELERIVRTLEEGKVKLDDAIAAYSRGVLMKRHCEVKLTEAEAKIEKVVPSADGGLTVEPTTLR